MTALVSVVTPTRPGREELLLDRCVPSVTKLDWPARYVEHVIVSDENPGLRETVRAELEYPVRFVEINDTWRDGVRERSVGAVPWAVGSLLALGEFVAFLGDDDEVLPDHVSRHVEAMRRDSAMFSVGPVQFVVRGSHAFVIGDDTFAHGHLDATGIMCHRDALRRATWTATGEDAADWRLVRDWRAAGLVGTFIGGEPTVLHHDGWAARM